MNDVLPDPIKGHRLFLLHPFSEFQKVDLINSFSFFLEVLLENLSDTLLVAKEIVIGVGNQADRNQIV